MAGGQRGKHAKEVHQRNISLPLFLLPIGYSCHDYHYCNRGLEHKRMEEKNTKGKWGIFALSLSIRETPFQLLAPELVVSWNSVYTNAHFWVLGCTEFRLGNAGGKKIVNSLPVEVVLQIPVFFPNPPVTIYFSESSVICSIHATMLYSCIQWERHYKMCLPRTRIPNYYFLK